MTGSSQANPWRGYIVLSLVWLAVTGGVWFMARRPVAEAIQVLPAPSATPSPASRPSPTSLAPAVPPAAPTPGALRVDVAGAVQTPGVYALPPGSIVADAIAAAGGAAPGAALDRLNKAAALGDGVQVYVPRLTETSIPEPVAPAPPSAANAGRSGTASSTLLSGGAAASAQPIDINQATAEQLETLPGIGPELARRVIAARPYASVDELDRVSGIGTARLEQIRPYVCVR